VAQAEWSPCDDGDRDFLMLFAGPHFARQRLRPPGAAALPSPQSVLWHESENGGRGGLRARRRTRSVLIPSLRRGSLREGSPLIAGAVVFQLPERRLARRLGGGARHRRYGSSTACSTIERRSSV